MTMVDSAGLIELGDEYGLRAVALRVVRDAWQGALDILDEGAARLDRWRADDAQGQRARMGAGAERMRAEALMIQARKIWATPPEAMAAAPVAPARGCMRLVDAVDVSPELGMSNTGEWLVRAQVSGQRWENACQLTVMVELARRAHVKKAGSADGFVAPSTPGQIQMGQRYAMLVERHDAGGTKCASGEARTDGGGQGGCFMDAYLAVGEELRAIRRRIGDGQAMAVRRVRPSVRGGDGVVKRGIMDRRLVDMVCLGGMDLTAVLKAHGWGAKGDNRATLKAALSAALDRMARPAHAH